MQAALFHAFKSRFFLWRQKQKTGVVKHGDDDIGQIVNIPGKESRLNEIAFNLDMLDMQDPNANRGRK